MNTHEIFFHHRSHSAWGLAAALMIVVLTLGCATRAKEAKADQPKDAPKPVTAAVVQTVAPIPPGTDQQNKGGWGRFVSFKDGTLTLKGNHGVLVWNNVAESTRVMHWDDASNGYKPSGTTEVLSKVEAGRWTDIANDRAQIRIGARKGRTVGTFISFKNDRLLMAGKDLGESYTKKYGNQLHFNKFAEGVPVYESIDGGDYTLVGTAEKILPTVKEGTIVTTHAEGDDNITRIDLGVQKKK
ncbi:MAG TPA: hypothetical protein VNT99_10975 [Methylomirabilota bacterium]|nr:hypothetical protein [Methylomirabilota bacterium]